MDTTVPTRPTAADTLPRGPLLLIGALLLAALLGVAAVRCPAPRFARPMPHQWRTRSCASRTGPTAASRCSTPQRPPDRIGPGRSRLPARHAARAGPRAAQAQGLGAEPAFELIARADGRLTLIDPATGDRVDLESFGPTNAAVFARLLDARPVR